MVSRVFVFSFAHPGNAVVVYSRHHAFLVLFCFTSSQRSFLLLRAILFLDASKGNEGAILNRLLVREGLLKEGSGKEKDVAEGKGHCLRERERVMTNEIAMDGF